MDRTNKELIRNLITRLGLARLHLLIRKVKGENVDHLLLSSLSERFSAIYTNRVWLNGRQAGSLSGSGSEIDNTGSVRSRVADLLSGFGIQALLDVGCGDFNWMKEVQLSCLYIGIDIVTEIIARNARVYGSPQRTFFVLDATRDKLPVADAALCREVLFHLSFRDIWRLIDNLRDSQTMFLIATNDSGLQRNADILSEDFRLLNLREAPFLFPAPILSIADDALAQGRVLSVWRVADLTAQATQRRRRTSV